MKKLFSKHLDSLNISFVWDKDGRCNMGRSKSSASISVSIEKKRFSSLGDSFWASFNIGNPMFILFRRQEVKKNMVTYVASELRQECDLSQELKDQAFSALTAYPLGISNTV